MALPLWKSGSVLIWALLVAFVVLSGAAAHHIATDLANRLKVNVGKPRLSLVLRNPIEIFQPPKYDHFGVGDTIVSLLIDGRKWIKHCDFQSVAGLDKFFTSKEGISILRGNCQFPVWVLKRNFCIGIHGYSSGHPPVILGFYRERSVPTTSELLERLYVDPRTFGVNQRLRLFVYDFQCADSYKNSNDSCDEQPDVWEVLRRKQATEIAIPVTVAPIILCVGILLLYYRSGRVPSLIGVVLVGDGLGAFFLPIYWQRECDQKHKQPGFHHGTIVPFQSGFEARFMPISTYENFKLGHYGKSC
jgi:hypothetical protein